MEETVIEDCGG